MNREDVKIGMRVIFRLDRETNGSNKNLAADGRHGIVIDFSTTGSGSVGVKFDLPFRDGHNLTGKLRKPNDTRGYYVSPCALDLEESKPKAVPKAKPEPTPAPQEKRLPNAGDRVILTAEASYSFAKAGAKGEITRIGEGIVSIWLDDPTDKLQGAKETNFTNWHYLPDQWRFDDEEPKPMPKDYYAQTDKPCISNSMALQRAFDYFNLTLFDNKLPPLMLCVSRNANIIGGYYSPDKWTDADKGTSLSELSINANLMDSGDAVKIFGILIHEMSHHWQWYLGKPGRSGYHNQEWADKAKWLGLKINTPDGKETGQTVGTDVILNGPSRAADAIATMPDDAIFPFIAIPLHDDPPKPPEGGGGEGGGKPGTPGEPGEPGKEGTPGEPGEGGEGGGGGSTPAPQPEDKPSGKEGEAYAIPKSGKRSRYTCPMCGTNVWGKSGLGLICSPCSMMMVEATGYKEE